MVGWPLELGVLVSPRVSCSSGQAGQGEEGAHQHSETALPVRVPPSEPVTGPLLPPLQALHGGERCGAHGGSVYVQGTMHTRPTPQPH